MCTHSYCQGWEEGRVGNDSKWFGWWKSGNWNKGIGFTAVAQWQHDDQAGCVPSPLWAAPSWETPKLCLGSAGARGQHQGQRAELQGGWSESHLEELGPSGGSWQFYNSQKQTSSFASTVFAVFLPPHSHQPLTEWPGAAGVTKASRHDTWIQMLAVGAGLVPGTAAHQDLAVVTSWLQNSRSYGKQESDNIF